MAQTGYTPISLYYTTTAAAVPTAGNLVNGELAINITDGKLYYKNNSGVVTLLAGATAGPAGGSNTQVQFNSSGALSGSSSLTWDGTTLAATKFSGALNGTVGATTPSTGAFTTVTATGGVDKLTNATGVVSVAASAAPSSGQVLTATSSTVATWQTPSTATPTVLGTVYGSMTTSGGSPYLTALGYNAAPSNTGVSNTAVGASALFTNTSGTNNTAMGYQAMYSANTGGYSVAVGYQALYSMAGTAGDVDNVAVGYQAGYGYTTGYNSTFIGHQAGYSGTANSTGLAVTYIGFKAAASSSSVSNEMVVSCGGTQVGKGASTGFISPNGGACYQGNNGATWSVTSDQRLKKNIIDNNTGLEKITAIQVRNFEYRLPEEVDAELKPTDAIKKEGVQFGVIAQELQLVLPECVKTESTGVMSVNADNLTWYLVNAIKELDAKFEAYKLTHP
jgi:hypothetical protein